MDISQNAKEKKSESGPSEFATSEDSPVDVPPKKIKESRERKIGEDENERVEC